MNQQADCVSLILEYRSKFPASEAKRLFRDKPVILLLCDYSDSIKQCSAFVKAELVKIIQQVFFNGRALNVQVWLDVQVLNQLAGLGLDGSDSRSAAIMICLGAERVDEGGDFGVIENAIFGSSETFPSGFKAKLKPHLEQFKARSRATGRTLTITPFLDRGAFLLPDWSALETEVLTDSLLQKIAQNIQKQNNMLTENQSQLDIRAKLEGLVSSSDSALTKDSPTEQLQTIDEQITFAVSAIREYFQEKRCDSETARNIYNGKNRLKKVAKTLNDFKDLLEVAAEMGEISYLNDGTSTKVSLIN